MRLRVMVETTDGFKIAEQDLRLRGPGEFFGQRQHGSYDFKLADLIKDRRILELANREAENLLKEDPNLTDFKNIFLRRELVRQFKGKIQLGTIG
jgi:ATP-dependent DNA helicase RecG